MSTSTRLSTMLRTFVLMAGLTGLLLSVGYLIGGSSMLLIVAVFSVLMNAAMFWFSGPIALKMSRAREVSPQEAPELHRMVNSLAARAGVPSPRVYVTPDPQPNAFATGRSPAHAAIAVTEGIQRSLSTRELEGVIAHEMAHIVNRDILIASIAAMIAGVISAVANVLQFSLLFGGGDEESPLGILGTLATIILAPMAALVIQMAISRQREYRADATGAELLGDPHPLADALVSLHRGIDAQPMLAPSAAAPLYIANPFGRGAGARLGSLFSTHPPMEERVRRLRGLAAPAAPRMRTVHTY